MLMAELLSYRAGGGAAETAGAGGRNGAFLFEEHRRSLPVSCVITLVAEDARVHAYRGCVKVRRIPPTFLPSLYLLSLRCLAVPLEHILPL